MRVAKHPRSLLDAVAVRLRRPAAALRTPENRQKVCSMTTMLDTPVDCGSWEAPARQPADSEPSKAQQPPADTAGLNSEDAMARLAVAAGVL